MAEKKDRRKDLKERKKLVQSRLETEGVAEIQCRKIRAEDHPFHRFEFWFIYYYTQMFWSEKGKHLRNKVGTPVAILCASERGVLPPATEWNDRCFRGHQSMKNEEFLRLWKRVTYYQGTPAVIQRPCALGRKCPGEKSAFANDEGKCVEEG